MIHGFESVSKITLIGLIQMNIPDQKGEDKGAHETEAPYLAWSTN